MALAGEGPPPCPGRERVGSVNVNGWNVLRKRELVESFKRGRFYVMWIQENYTEGCGVMECVIRMEEEVWCGVDDKQGKGKGRVCTPNASWDMGRHRGTWMEGV